MSRLCCLLVGLFLVWQGGVLAYEELGLVAARDAARGGRHGRPPAPTEKLEAAYATFSSTRRESEDLAARELDVALVLDARGVPGGAAGTAERRQRIRQAAARLARASPLSARAWCVLSLANAKSDGVTPRATDQLRACYAFGSREIGVVEGRLMFALAAWDELPRDLRNVAMIDVAIGLSDPVQSEFMAKRLAYAVATIPPQRAPLAETLLEHYGERLKTTYAQALDNYRRVAKTRAGTH